MQSLIAGDIVICATRPATFDEAIPLIASSGTVEPDWIDTFRREVNWVQIRRPRNRDGSTAAPLPCDPVLLRPILQAISPGRHEISVKRWGNIKGELAARVVLVAVPERRQTLIFIDLFNVLEIAIVHPYEGTEFRLESYGVDLLTGQEVSVHADSDFIAKLPWIASHVLGQPELNSLFEARVGRVIGTARARRSSSATSTRSEPSCHTHLQPRGHCRPSGAW